MAHRMGSKKADERLKYLGKIMNDPRLDNTWKLLDSAFEQRQKARRSWFNNLLRIGIVATTILTVALVFCVWYFTR